MGLPEVGFKAVVKDGPKAIKQSQAFSKSMQAVQQTAKKTSVKGGFAGLADTSKQLRGMGGVMQQIIPDLSKFSGGLGSAKGALATMTPQTMAAAGALGAMTVALAATVAGWTAFIKLGSRGAQLQPTINAFGNIVAGSVNSTKALNSLRTSTRGTVSDMELMRLSTLALQGQSAEFRQELLQVGDDGKIGMGKVIDSVNRISEATGGNAEVIREKFLTGLRLQSKLRTDDVSVSADQAIANKRYAESIGVAVSALTEQQQKAAFVRESLRQLDEVTAQLGDSNKTLENMRLPFVFLQNTLDKLALAIQPVFSVFAQFIGDLTRGAMAISNFVLPIFAAMASIIGTVLSTSYSIARAAFMIFIAPLQGFAEQVAPYIIAVFQMIAAAVQAFGETIARVANVIGQKVNAFLAQFGTSIGKMVTDLILAMAKGGAFIVGSFAAGLLSGGKYVVKAVTAIAQIVANFLEGFSPPKEGPLANIDKGGEKVAIAWADGFTSGFVQPIDKAAAEVEARLGEIGTFGAERVAMRLKALDKAIQPFVDLLDIAKADLEAIAGFTDPALEAIERQQAQLLREGQFEAVKALDMQAQKLQELQRLRQRDVDQSQIALSIVQSRQAQERALLAIQKRRTKNQKQQAGAAEKVTDAAGKAKKPTGAAPPPEEAEAGGLQFGEGPDMFSSEAIEAAKDAIGGALGEGLEDSGFNEALAGFTESTSELGVELNRIQEADPVGKLEEKFKGLGGIMDDPLGTLQNKFDNTLDNMAIAIQDKLNFNTAIQNIQALSSTLSNVNTETLNTGINTITGSLSSLIGVDITAIGTAFDTLKSTMLSSLTSMVFNLLLLPAQVESILGNTGTVTSGIVNFVAIASTQFNALKTSMSNAFLNVFNPGKVLGTGGLVTMALGEGGFIRLIFDGFVSFLGEKIDAMKSRLLTFVLTDIPTALKDLPATLKTTLVDPFLSAINAAIDGIDNVLPNEVPINFGTVEIPNFTNPMALIEGETIPVDLGGFTIDMPDTPFRDAISAVGLASGGIGVSGMMLVGEEGPELIQVSRPIDVFPADISRAILASANPIMAGQGGGGGNTTNNTRNIAQQTTINVSSPEQASLIQRQALAFGRR